MCLSIHRCTDVIQLHEHWSHLKYPGVSPGLSPSSLGGQGSSVGPRSLLQSSAEPQKAPDASLQAAEEELCVEVRASWGAVTALNQAILCSCQVDAFTSHQGLLLKRGYAGFWCFLFFVFLFQCKDISSLCSPAACSKEGSTCRGEQGGGILICPNQMRRAAPDRAFGLSGVSKRKRFSCLTSALVDTCSTL